jgi:hypothetical protein
MPVVSVDPECVTCPTGTRPDLPHVIPRQADLAADLRGPRVFGLLGGETGRHVPEPVMDDLAARLASALRVTSS